MRGLVRNKQKMWYSILGEPQPIYQTDEEGNIIYDTMPDGSRKPRTTGDMTNGYEEPVEFRGNIAYKGGIAEDAPFGNDLSEYTAVLYANNLPLAEATLIWYQHEPIVVNGQVDKSSADYRVKRVPPVLDEMVYLLEGLS